MIVRSIVEFLVNLIPTFTMPAEILGAFAEATSLIIQINHYIPIGTFISCLGVYFTVWLVCAVISAILALL